MMPGRPPATSMPALAESLAATFVKVAPQPTFGGFTLDELIRRAGRAASYEAFGIEALEILAAREPGIEQCLAEIQRSAKALVVIRALLMALEPHAPTVHALVYAHAASDDLSGAGR